MGEKNQLTIYKMRIFLLLSLIFINCATVSKTCNVEYFEKKCKQFRNFDIDKLYECLPNSDRFLNLFNNFKTTSFRRESNMFFFRFNGNRNDTLFEFFAIGKSERFFKLISYPTELKPIDNKPVYIGEIKLVIDSSQYTFIRNSIEKISVSNWEKENQMKFNKRIFKVIKSDTCIIAN